MKKANFILLSILFVITSASSSLAAPIKAPSNILPDSYPSKLHITPSGEMLHEELPLGEYHQPEWTVKRPFAQTRVYVLPPWQVGAEVGWDGIFPGGHSPQHVIHEEIEIGLSRRLQLDFENHDKRGLFIPEEERRKADADIEEAGDSWHHDSNAIELSYALADWGELPLNPVIKGEWKFNHKAADAYEGKILLGEELASRWHWAMNLFYEQQIGDEKEREFAVSQAFAYTVIDQYLSVGVEMNLSSESEKDSRNKMEAAFVIGPTLQVRPTEETHIDVVPLFGIGEEAPQAEMLVFVGFDFDASGEDHEMSEPASLRGK